MTARLFVAAGIFHPEPGGPATYLHEILPALQQRGWFARVLTYGESTADSYPYPVTRVARRILPLRMLHYHWLARREVAQADLIYAHTIDLPVQWGTLPRIIKIVGDQAWERCIRRGWVPPATDVDAFQTGDYGSLVDRQRKARSQQVRAFDAVIVPGQYLKQMVCGWGVPEERVHVIYNALPGISAALPGSQRAARQVLDWDDRPVLLTAARLFAWKGIDHLIRALQQVPDVRLIVAGDGPQRAYLQQLAAPLGDRVQFAGQIARDRLHTMMRAADYVTLYSGYEGLSHTLLEALYVGTPVIASDKGGNPEVVQHGSNGLLVPYVDLDALVDTLRYAFQPGQRAAFATNTAHNMERFTFETMVQQTDYILRSYL